MAEMKPAYLVHGDDDVKLDSWRGRVRTRVAEDQGADLEVLRDEKLSGAAVADALGLLTLGVGKRWVVADGVQDWKEKDVAPVAEALAHPDPDTVVIFIAESNPKARRGSPAYKGQAPAALAKAVEKAGGEVHLCEAPKPRGLPKWVLERAKELNLNLDREAPRRWSSLWVSRTAGRGCAACCASSRSSSYTSPRERRSIARPSRRSPRATSRRGSTRWPMP